MLKPLLASLALIASPGPDVAAKAGPRLEVGVAPSQDKLRPFDPVPAETTLALEAPRGACASGQIAVRSGARFLGLSARATPLVVPGRASGALSLALYRVGHVVLSRPSGPDGEAGEWPDPLIPVRDAWFREERRAFPIDLTPDRLQAIWVEACVPLSADPGELQGQVILEQHRHAVATVPVRLTVWPVVLPSTSTKPVTFGLSTLLGTRALGKPGDPELARALAAAALRHRITPHALSANPPSGRCDAQGCALDFTTYDAEMAPILDGTLVPGVRGTFAEVRLPGAILRQPDTVLVAALRAWRTHFDARGWADRLWLYTLDEPKPSDLPELVRRARAAHAAGVRVFATTTPSPTLNGLVDAYVPNLDFFAASGAGPFHSASPLRADPRPFWYASCMSHGCSEQPDASRQRTRWKETFSGWPGYEIDRPGAAALAMGWLAFREGVAGELYYDMLQGWGADRAKDTKDARTWDDVRAFAGNGDGLLLYPGRPDEWGGVHPFPVESIRLKLIREAQEDQELLLLAARTGHRALADRLVRDLAPALRKWERDPKRYLQARHQLLAALSGSAAAVPMPAAGTLGASAR